MLTVHAFATCQGFPSPTPRCRHPPLRCNHMIMLLPKSEDGNEKEEEEGEEGEEGKQKEGLNPPS